MATLQVIGGGKMGTALFGGLIASGWAQPSDIRVVEKLQGRRDELAESFPGVELSDEIGPCDAAIVAVKPNDTVAACAALARSGSPSRVLSVAAGVPIVALEAALGPGVAVVRAMPNTPALVGAGVAAIAPGTHATPDDVAWARSILAAVGSVVEVSEGQLDAVTGLSGSGPAYVFLVAEAMIEAGVLVGLTRPVAHELAIGTLLGASKLLAVGDRSPAELRADVTSPGGTTAAGLRALEDRAVRAAFLAAVEAATRRSEALGKA